MGLFKDFLGGFAEGYINERGIDGTLQDLGDLAKGVKNFISSNISSGENDNPLADGYNEIMTEGNYDEAIDFIKECYNGEEKDYAYYYIGNAYAHMGEYEAAIDQLQQASYLCPTLTDDSAVIRETLEEAKRQNQYFKSWKETIENIERYKENKKFNDAIMLLDNFYYKYDKGEKDFHYWNNLFDIHTAQEYAKDDVFSVNDKNIQYDLTKMRELVSDSTYDTLNSKEDQLKSFKFTIKVCKLQERKEFDIAKIEIEKYYKDDHNKEINSSYWYDLLTNYIGALRNNILVGHSREVDLNNASNALSQYSKIIKTEEDLEFRELLEEEVADLQVHLDNFKSVTTEKKTPKIEANEKSKSEKEFLEELRLCYEDGVITDKERRILDRLRKNLGITEERAKELEAQCNPSILTGEEEEYAIEYKAALENGTISEKERRLLNRLSKSLNLTEERTLAIEKIVQTKQI